MISVLLHLLVELVRQILGYLFFSYLGLVLVVGTVATIVVVLLQWALNRKKP